VSKLRVLFVCGRNQWRSPTAESIYRDDERLIVRAAGTSGNSPRPVSIKDLDWADLVLTMERKHRFKIVNMFRDQGELPRMVSLDIPDEFQRMDPELIRLIEERTELELENWFKS
jgi:predicted protein tyrosine phosphatase